VIKLTQNLLDR